MLCANILENFMLNLSHLVATMEKFWLAGNRRDYFLLIQSQLIQEVLLLSMVKEHFYK